MKELQFKKIVQEELAKIFREKYQLKEFFGFSKKEKDQKNAKEKLSLAFKEIDKYDFKRIFKQPADNLNSQSVNKLIDIVLKDISDNLPTVKILMPNLFEKQSGSGAMKASIEHQGNILNGIVPSNFWFLVLNGKLMKDSDSKDKLKQELKKIYKI